MDAVHELRRVLDDYAPTFTDDEIPKAAVEFGKALAQATGPLLGRPEVLDLLRRGCEVFPASVRLRDMLGYALRLAGRHEESNEVYSGALRIHRIAATYRAEIKKEEDVLPTWQVADCIRKCASQENPRKGPGDL